MQKLNGIVGEWCTWWRGDPGSSLAQVAFLMVLLAGFQGPSKINIYFKALDPLHGIYDYLMSTKK